MAIQTIFLDIYMKKLPKDQMSDFLFEPIDIKQKCPKYNFKLYTNKFLLKLIQIVDYFVIVYKYIF